MRIFVFAVAVLAGCFRGEPPPPARPTVEATRPLAVRGTTLSDALGFLPGNAEMVLVVDLRRVRTSPLWKRIDPLLRKQTATYVPIIASACNFDPLAMRSISIGLTDVKGAVPGGTFVIRGYDRALFMKCLETARAGNPKDIAIDHGVVTVTTGTTRMTMAFADAATLVASFGPNVSVDTMRATLDGGAPLRLAPWFPDLIAKIDVAAPAWFIANGTLGASSFNVGATAVTGTVALDGGVAATLRMRFDAPDKAALTTATLQGQVTSAQGFLEELAIEADDVDVVVRIRASVAQAEMILGLLGAP